MKYHLHLVTKEGSSDCLGYTDHTCGGFDLTPDFIILYDRDPIKDAEAKPIKLVSLKNFVYVDIDSVEEEH